MHYPQFLRCIWHPLLYNFPSEPQVNLEILQHPESQCFVVLQCRRSTATTPCLKIKGRRCLVSEDFKTEIEWKYDIKHRSIYSPTSPLLHITFWHVNISIWATNWSISGNSICSWCSYWSTANDVGQNIWSS